MTTSVRAVAIGLAGLLACGDGPTGLESDGRGLILYTRETTGQRSSEIWVMRPDGSDARQLTSNAIWDGEPHWSPDGRRIVFSSMSDSNPGSPIRRAEIHVMNADGSAVRKLTDEPGSRHAMSPRWSPDGTRIAFNRLRFATPVRIYVMDADGSDVRPLSPEAGGDFYPDWSPDGSKILFISTHPPTYRRILQVMNADGSNIQTLGGDAICAGYVQGARWSPDGTRILYACDAGGRLMINTMLANGTGIDTVSHPASPIYNIGLPVWSPDGSQIAFTSGSNGLSDVFVMSSTGGGEMRITNDSAFELVSDWNRPR